MGITQEQRDYPGTRNWYAKRVCEVIAHGGKRFTPERTGWGDYLARWTWLTDKGLEVDPDA